MIKLLNMTIEGFGSIGEPQSVNLDAGGLVLIKAPNGSGKTTLFSAIPWILYGKNIKGKSMVGTWKKNQPNNYKGTKGQLYFETDKGIYQIIRCQNYTGKLEDGAKGGDRIILTHNGLPLQIKGKVNIQQAINEALGCSYELFMSSIMFGQGMKRLIQEENNDKKKIFEEIFQLGYLNTARDIAVEERTKLLSQYHEVESDYRETKKSLELTQVTYREVLDKEKNYQSLLKSQKKEVEDKINKFKDKLSQFKAKRSKEDFGELYEITKYGINELEEQLEKVEQVEDTPLIDVVQDTINLLEAKQIKEALKNLRRIITAFKQAENIRKELKILNKQLSEARDKYKEQKRLEENIQFVKEEIKELKANKFGGKEINITSPKYKQEIKDLTYSLKVLENHKDKLDNQLENYNWVLNDPLSNSGIKSYLFDSSLQTLNDILLKYASILGFRIEFNVDLDSASKKFVTLIEKDGIIADYSELSGGEKGLVNLTMCLALHETLTLSQSINILLLDEVFENLDGDNIELVISLIRTLSESKTIFLISHIENLPFGNCKSLEVTKKYGLTHYSQL